MSTQQGDLDLLLSLQERVIETPPPSPSSNPYLKSRRLPLSIDGSLPLSGDGSPSRLRNRDMSVFRDSVLDFLDYMPEPKIISPTVKKFNSDPPVVDKFSGLKIRDQLVSPLELSNHFSDIRFIRLPAIKNLLMGDKLSGCWATVGVLTEKRKPLTCSTGKKYVIWKFGCLDEMLISTFLFGDAYEKYMNEMVGTVFALFNCNVRKHATGSFSLSIYNARQMLKVGTSADYGVCKGKRKDGMPCMIIINKRDGVYCKYHNSKSAEKFFTKRPELMGSNLRTAFRSSEKSEGIHLVKPLGDMTNIGNHSKPAKPKIMSLERLKETLSKSNMIGNGLVNATKYLADATAKKDFENKKKGIAPLNEKEDSPTKNHQGKKRKLPKQDEEKLKQTTEKMIELDYVSSDEENDSYRLAKMFR